MATYSRVEAEDAVKEFVYLLSRKDAGLRKAILFGSYVKGDFSEYSDFDLLLVSTSFTGVPRNDIPFYSEFIGKAPFDNISAVTYSVEDFLAKDPFIKEVLATGIEIPIPHSA